MFYNESLLKDLFEEDQRDRSILFQIKRHMMSLNDVKNISDVVSMLKEFKNKKEGFFSQEFEMKFTALINKLSEISTQNNLQNAPNSSNNFADSNAKCNLLINETLKINDAKRRQEVTHLMPIIVHKTAESGYDIRCGGNRFRRCIRTWHGICCIIKGAHLKWFKINEPE